MSVGEVYIEPPGNPKLATSYYGENSDELHMAFLTLHFSIANGILINLKKR